MAAGLRMMIMHARQAAARAPEAAGERLLAAGCWRAVPGPAPATCGAGGGAADDDPAAAREAAGGRGLAGVINSMAMDWNSATWDTSLADVSPLKILCY